VREIIEIPVFKVAEGDNKPLFSGQKFISDKTYEGFRFLEYALTDRHSFYFYFIEFPGEQNNRYLWERIIPKSPFCLYLYDADDKSVNKFIQEYSRYKTPVFLAAEKDTELSHEILSLFNDKVARYDISQENYFNVFFREILEKLV
jgi:hypothetical protein